MMRVRPQGSQFDLCSWATGMGFVDACVASIVLLPRRIDATAFVTLWAEPTILVGPVVEKRSEESLTLGYMLLAAFRPFSVGLWLAMLGVVIFTSLMITYFEPWMFQRQKRHTLYGTHWGASMIVNAIAWRFFSSDISTYGTWTCCIDMSLLKAAPGDGGWWAVQRLAEEKRPICRSSAWPTIQGKVLHLPLKNIEKWKPSVNDGTMMDDVSNVSKCLKFNLWRIPEPPRRPARAVIFTSHGDCFQQCRCWFLLFPCVSLLSFPAFFLSFWFSSFTKNHATETCAEAACSLYGVQ